MRYLTTLALTALSFGQLYRSGTSTRSWTDTFEQALPTLGDGAEAVVMTTEVLEILDRMETPALLAPRALVSAPALRGSQSPSVEIMRRLSV